MLNHYGFYQRKKELSKKELSRVSIEMHKKITYLGMSRKGDVHLYYFSFMPKKRTKEEVEILREAGLVRMINRK